MTDGHCDHCDRECPAGFVNYEEPVMPHQNSQGTYWPTGHCPACKERARIVAWMRAQVAITSATDWPAVAVAAGYSAGLAEMIERGHAG